MGSVLIHVLKNLKTIHECVSVKPVKYLNHVHHLIRQNVDQKADVLEVHELLPLVLLDLEDLEDQHLLNLSHDQLLE